MNSPTDKLPQGFEFLDHTADMILHGYGPLVQDAFTQTALSMFEMMSPDSRRKITRKERIQIEVSGDTHERLLYNFLNEILGGIWGEKKILVGHIEILNFNRNVVVSEKSDDENHKENDNDDTSKKETEYIWSLRADCYGEEFDRTKHEAGTEVKAITFHGVKVEEREEDMLYHCHIVVDI